MKLCLVLGLLGAQFALAEGKCRHTGQDYTLENMDLPVCENMESGIDVFRNGTIPGTAGGSASGRSTTRNGGASLGGFSSQGVPAGGQVGGASGSPSGPSATGTGGSSGSSGTGSSNSFGNNGSASRGPASENLPNGGPKGNTGGSGYGEMYPSGGDARWMK